MEQSNKKGKNDMAKSVKWWKNAVVYQIYPRSFQDSNGDGIGDLKGIEQRLPYLQELGIDVIWISPIFCSPMEDNGYDISDYYQVDPIFGTNEDMDSLICEAGKRGIKIILDLVVNHCSDEHEWFQRAVEDENSKEAAYFYFVRTKDGKEPNNWRSNFGGSVWSKLKDGRWYYHTFSPKQPDLNWENPQLRQEIYKMINWWMEKGIAGFRIDAITFIKKDLTFASVEMDDKKRYPVENLENYPGIEKFLQELKKETFDKFDCLTAAEAPGVDEESFESYAGESGYFSMIFDFSWENMEEEADKSKPEAVERLKKRIFNSQCFNSRHGWCGVFLENHDQSRCLNRYLEEKDRNRYSASALATLYFFLHGTPYIYEGQEIGMKNAKWNSIDEMMDVRAKITWKERVEQGEDGQEVLKYFSELGRDNARTPMQWNDSENAGFTTGKPWMKVQENYREINVAKQQNETDSLLAYYKKLIKLRKSEKLADIMSKGDFCPVFEKKEGMIAYKRTYADKEALVLVNLLNQDQILSWEWGTGKEILLNNYKDIRMQDQKIVLYPYQAIVL